MGLAQNSRWTVFQHETRDRSPRSLSFLHLLKSRLFRAPVRIKQGKANSAWWLAGKQTLANAYRPCSLGPPPVGLLQAARGELNVPFTRGLDLPISLLVSPGPGPHIRLMTPRRVAAEMFRE